jgi:hypothetical protein
VLKTAVVGLALLLCSPSAFPREAGTPAREDDLYSVALFASIAAMEKSWGHIDDSDGGSGMRTDYRHMIVVKNPEITEGLPQQLGDYSVEYLDDQSLISRYEKLRKEFSVLEIRPIHNTGGKLTIHIAMNYVTHKKRHLNFGISNWGDVEFSYDCENQRYIISAVKLGGI